MTKKKKDSSLFRDGLVRILLGKKYVPLWYFKKYKHSMQDLLKRKDRKIKELEMEKETLFNALVRQGKQNFDEKKTK